MNNWIFCILLIPFFFGYSSISINTDNLNQIITKATSMVENDILHTNGTHAWAIDSLGNREYLDINNFTNIINNNRRDLLNVIIEGAKKT